MDMDFIVAVVVVVKIHAFFNFCTVSNSTVSMYHFYY